MSSTVTPPPLPGDMVGSFCLGESIGVGGNATVYRSSSPHHGDVAIKVLHPGKADSPEGQRLRREFLALEELQHTGVVRVYEAGLHGEYPWICMEYVDGTDLGSQVKQWQTAPTRDRFEQVERILRDLCEALAYVHERGLVHRDI
ncbi:MAG: protein kinase, partial [Myxococcota bacterium]|nr:protein kinase [Myxococcota bacterium]